MTKVQRLLASICCSLMVSIGHADPVVSLPVDIAPQPLTQALDEFSRKTGLQFAVKSELAAELQSKGARSTQSAADALSQLLEGTGLKFEFINQKTVRIYAASAAAEPPPSPTAAPAAAHSESHADSQPASLGHTLVTATRREEQMNKVPISIALWTQEAMEASGVKSMTELGALTPGVTFSTRPAVGGDLYTDIAIRGVSERHGGAVGIYLDDTQIPPARAGTYLRSFPLTFDLDRIEVLRGPQSTLLGNYTQGGAVRFITKQPSLTAFSGLMRTEWGTTASGDASYEVGAAAGGPVINDVLGFRISGWYREDGGYVDRVDPFTGAIVDANSNRYAGKTARAALTFAPAETVRITPSLTYQSISIHDTSTFYTVLSNPKAGDLRNGSLLQQPFNDGYYLASLKVTAAFRIAEMSSMTSYFDRTATAAFDFTPLPATGYADAAWLCAGIEQRTLSEELRFNSADPDAALTWLAGAFFSSEHAHHSGRTFENGLADPGDGTVIDQTQLAGFGQITLRMTKRLTASAGLRIGRSEHESVTETPPILSAAAADTWSAPRLVLSYQADEHNLAYLTAAKGYGSGSVYPKIFAGDTTWPYPADTLWSYEIGSKSDLFGGRVHVDASVFHAHLNNGPPDYSMMVGEVHPSPGATKSNGFDVAVQALVTDRVRVALGIAHADVRYQQTLKLGDVVFVRNGDSVEGAPWSSTASIERDFSLSHDVTANLRAEDVFHSHESGQLYCTNPAPFYDGCVPNPSTNVLNLRANVRGLNFDVAALVSNALNSQPTLNNAAQSKMGLTLNPRTISVSGTWRF
jgi:iron complex outermembrane receptor protein